MYTSYRSKEKEICEVGMVEMSTTCVYPWAMVVHLDNTSENKCKNCHKSHNQNVHFKNGYGCFHCLQQGM